MKYLVLAILITFASCTPKGSVLDMEKSQVQLRSIQTRAFDTADKKFMMQAVINTLQDLDFVIDKADLTIGMVSSTKYVNNQTLKTTVTVRKKGKTQLLVRMNAQYGLQAIEQPKAYQDFFTALEKSVFLAAHQVD